MSIFSNVSGPRTRKSKFDLTHEKKMSIRMGGLYPMALQEILPGDKFRGTSEIFLRFAPMIAPVMHRVNAYVHYFFVPNRLVWNQWEDFITGGKDGTLAPETPRIMINEDNKARFAQNWLSDYLGIPPTSDFPGTITQPLHVSAMPFRAYQLIFNEYYRDQNLNDGVEFSLDGGEITDVADVQALTGTRFRAWEKDYFTSALPWAQRGADISIPQTPNTQAIAYDALNLQNPVDGTQFDNVEINGTSGGMSAKDSSGTGFKNISIDPGSGIQIEDLRRSARLQEWLERQARGGARYIETILSHFGQRSSDARLQRPEYLGGGKTPVTISEVLNTTGTTTAPQGEMAGHGVAAGGIGGFNRTFEEHGYLMGIISVVPKTAYQQGISRLFTRTDKFHYAWPEFAQIGEQEIFNKELYADYDAADTSNNETFGYQARYAEYKYAPSTVHGEFRTFLKYWHMGRIFDSKPVLNDAFVTSDPTDRIFAVQEEGTQQLYCQILNKFSAIRPLPYANVPTL